MIVSMALLLLLGVALLSAPVAGITPSCVLLQLHLTCNQPFIATVDAFEEDTLLDDHAGRRRVSSGNTTTYDGPFVFCMAYDGFFDTTLEFYFVVGQQSCRKPSDRFERNHIALPAQPIRAFHQYRVDWNMTDAEEPTVTLLE